MVRRMDPEWATAQLPLEGGKQVLRLVTASIDWPDDGSARSNVWMLEEAADKIVVMKALGEGCGAFPSLGAALAAIEAAERVAASLRIVEGEPTAAANDP